jgi:hypothetical protein
MNTVDIGISDNHEDQLMILNVLSNTLYTDKVSAVLREYGCNAYDANVEADRGMTPIQVRLPNKLDPTVAIRDFGFGMTEEQILLTFCKLGRSTKRSSNAYTGMLGIGSKAGFAYGDSFNVTSFAQGVKTIYACVRLQGKPTLSKMYSEPTSEPDGVEIKVPVRQPDIAEFQNKAQRVFQYFKVFPHITGAKCDLHREKFEFAGKGWRYTGNSKSIAIMGNVGYDLSSSAMGATSNLTKLIDAGVELDFHIGDLEIAANREGLQYHDHTKAQILAKLRQVAKEISDIWSQKLVAAKSEWEAKQLYSDLIGEVNWGPKVFLRDAVRSQMTWKGKPITNGRVQLVDHLTYPSGTNPLMGGVAIVEYYHHRSYKKLRKTDTPESVLASKKNTLCVCDLPKIAPARVNGWFHRYSDAEKLIVFTFCNAATQDKYWKKHLDGAPFVLMSSIPPYVAPPNANGTTSGPSPHRSKHSRKVFVLDEVGVHATYSAPRSAWWEIAEVDIEADGGVYVVLDNFWVHGKTFVANESPHDFRERVKGLRDAGLIKGKVYGFKTGRVPKLGPNWIPLETDLAARLQKLVTPTFLQELADYNAVCAYTKFIPAKWASKFQKGTAVRDLLDEVARMSQPTSHAKVIALLQSGVVKPWLKSPQVLPKPTVDLKQKEKAMCDRYPLLTLLDKFSTPTYGDARMDHIAKYVHLMK